MYVNRYPRCGIPRSAIMLSLIFFIFTDGLVYNIIRLRGPEAATARKRINSGVYFRILRVGLYRQLYPDYPCKHNSTGIEERNEL